MLGPITIRRDGTTLALPASRKVRALLAYLALASLPVSRSALCDLLWDVPNDPRGELRWCLSKIRSLLDGGGCQRVLVVDKALSVARRQVDPILVRDVRAGDGVGLVLFHLACQLPRELNRSDLRPEGAAERPFDEAGNLALEVSQDTHAEAVSCYVLPVNCG